MSADTRPRRDTPLSGGEIPDDYGLYQGEGIPYAQALEAGLVTPSLVTGINVQPGPYGLAAVGVSAGQVAIQQRTIDQRITHSAAAVQESHPGETGGPYLRSEAPLMNGYGYDYNANADWGRIGRAALGAATGFITGGPAGAIVGGVTGYASGGNNAATGTGAGAGGLQGSSPCGSGFTLMGGNCVPIPTGGIVASGGPLVANCPPGYVKLGTTCVRPSAALPGGQPLTTQAGGPIAGRHGLALAPVVFSIASRRCPAGMVLGKDELCYEKRDLPKKQRKWNPGTKPLISGGEMNAIRTAAGVKKRFKRAARSLELSVLTPAQRAKLPKRRKR